jgi:hypothetical protein
MLGLLVGLVFMCCASASTETEKAVLFTLEDCTINRRFGVSESVPVVLRGAQPEHVDLQLNPALSLARRAEKLASELGRLIPSLLTYTPFYWADIELELVRADAVGAPVSGVRWATGNSSASAELALHPSVAQRFSSFAAGVVHDPIGVGSFIVNVTRSTLEEAALSVIPADARPGRPGALALNPFRTTHVAFDMPDANDGENKLALRCSINC